MYCFGRNYSSISLFISIHPFCVSCTRVRGCGWSLSQLSFINQRWCGVHPAVKFIRQFIAGPIYLLILCPFIFMENNLQHPKMFPCALNKNKALCSRVFFRCSSHLCSLRRSQRFFFLLSIFILHFLTSCCQRFMSEGKK